MNKIMILAASCVVASAMPVSAQRPGDLVSAQPVVDTPPGMPAGLRAWQMRYWTTDANGRLSQVTAMVLAPRDAPSHTPRDVLAWTHGTAGVATRCAPSLSPAFWTQAGIGGVRSGYVVVAPDYPGLGSDGVHPYLVGENTGRSVLDAVRAAGSIAAANSGKRFAVWGESQGGHAALWTGQLAKAYAPDLQLAGVAAAAPVTDLVENVRQVPNKAVGALMTSFIAYSWSRHYNASMATLGGLQTQGIMTRLAQNNCIELAAKPKLLTIAGILTVKNRLKDKDLGRIEPWARLARRNSPTTVDFGVPILIAQNPADDLVEPAVTRAHARALCRTGARLHYLSITGQGHATSANDSADETLAWIAARFAGTPAPNDCGQI